MAFASITTIKSRTAVLGAENIDTDQIIAARFLTTTSQDGLGQYAFYDWRYMQDGTLKSDSPLNASDIQERRILVGGANFGCGSSREHAPWALLDFGFRAVISTDIADIFKNNALKNGLLAIEVDRETHEALLATPGVEIEIDLPVQLVRLSNGRTVPFEIEAFAKSCLLNGVDTLGALLAQSEAIAAYERRRTVEG
ncbi:MAG: 3-isopropylmalate dehydratase small subunit [Pseudomonadota bacterium]